MLGKIGVGGKRTNKRVKSFEEKILCDVSWEKGDRFPLLYHPILSKKRRAPWNFSFKPFIFGSLFCNVLF